jgi:hypothetical protein
MHPSVTRAAWSFVVTLGLMPAVCFGWEFSDDFTDPAVDPLEWVEEEPAGNGLGDLVEQAGRLQFLSAAVVDPEFESAALYHFQPLLGFARGFETRVTMGNGLGASGAQAILLFRIGTDDGGTFSPRGFFTLQLGGTGDLGYQIGGFQPRDGGGDPFNTYDWGRLMEAAPSPQRLRVSYDPASRLIEYRTDGPAGTLLGSIGLGEAAGSIGRYDFAIGPADHLRVSLAAASYGPAIGADTVWFDDFAVAAVPEPAWSGLATGLLLLGGLLLRRRDCGRKSLPPPAAGK